MRRFDCQNDGDLVICAHRGVAFQRDFSKSRVAYDGEYLANYDRYAESPIAATLNAGRCALLARHAAPGASVLDVGAASGQFVRCAQSWGFAAKGYEVIPEAVQRLRDAGAWAEHPGAFDVVTYWDSLEHMDEPELSLGQVRKGALVLVAVPIMSDITKVGESKHFKPGEHYFYWAARGFIDWMALYGFRLLEQSTHEVDAGREDIGAFAFRRGLPDGRDHIDAYKEMHSTRHYGSSATELHLDSVAKIVRALKPASILDYGCGRSDLVAHFWLDGARKIGRFDPAIPMWKRMPQGPFDLILCCDVMEHIPMADVDAALAQIKANGGTALFTISTKLARAKLPDGRNAHVTLLTRDEWTRWIADVFGTVQALPSQWEHELALLAGGKA